MLSNFAARSAAVNWSAERSHAARRERGFHRDFRPGGDDQIHVGAHQLGCVRMELAGLLARGAEFHDQITAFDETTLAQFVTERRVPQGR